MKRSRSFASRLFALRAGVGVLGLIAAALIAAPSASATGTVNLAGHLYGASVGSGGITIHFPENATIHIAEFPNLKVKADPERGSWSLDVPDNAKVTPCADYPGHHPMCLQTFFTRGKDLNQVNFQMVDNTVANLLGMFSGAKTTTQPDGVTQRVTDCAIVSTFFEKEKRSFLDYDEFLAATPHGVAGATAVATSSTGQELPGPIYYNELVIPQPDRTESSVDGGVMWVNIPPGTYTITGTHPTARFASFQATCEKGRLINANPPWGLYEMARTEEPNPAVLPGPDPDTRVDATVLSAKVAKVGPGRRQVRVKVRTSEPVTVLTRAIQGKRRASLKKSLGKTGVVRLPLDRRFKSGGIRVNLTISDGSGNKVNSSVELHVPKS